MFEQLKRARRGAGFTQAQLGKELGLTMAGYRQKETGLRKMSIDEAVSIAKILGKSLDEVFLHDAQSK